MQKVEAYKSLLLS